MLKTILSIPGKSGLYKLVSSGKNLLVVETVDEVKKRMPVHGTDKVISLADIAMYTDETEVPLGEVFNNIKELKNGELVDLNYKKATPAELQGFMAEVLPNYDRDRVYNNDIKKLISWYNILVSNGLTDFIEKSE
ncbi:MAG: DUF5606 domain-containing protein [Bacteroidaceae bacterium]|nr:DUF5606 domain-containing protein [Bacteroidaceae bacterium]